VVASQPLGIATYATTAELRNIRWRPLGTADAAAATPAGAQGSAGN